MSGAVTLARTGAGRNRSAPPRRPSNGGGFGRSLWRWTRAVVGLLIIAVAIPISWLPGPLGLPIAVVGLAIVLQSSIWAKRRFIVLKRRHPNWVHPFRRLMRRRPEIAPVFWRMTLKSERLVLRRSRFLGRWRRRTFSRQRAAPRP